MGRRGWRRHALGVHRPTQVGVGWDESVGGWGRRCLGRVGDEVNGRDVVGGGLALEVYSNAGRFRRLGRVGGGAEAREVVGARKDVHGAPHPGHSCAREFITDACVRGGHCSEGDKCHAEGQEQSVVNSRHVETWPVRHKGKLVLPSRCPMSFPCQTLI